MKPLFTTVLLFGIVCLGEPHSVLAAQLVLPNQSAGSCPSVQIPVNLLTQGASLSGIQFDLQFNNSTLSVGAVSANSANAAGKQLSSSSVAANIERFLIFGLNQTAISDGTLVTLLAVISPTAPSGVYSLTLGNVLGTDSLGQPVAVTPTSGTLTVQTSSNLHSCQIVSAASFLAGPIAPGEIVTVTGLAIGPPLPLQPSGSVASTVLGGTSLLFDGNAAPLLYASPNQINAVVPYEVSGKTTTQLRLQSGQTSSPALSLQVKPAMPAIFTLESGAGQGAILNQDGTANSPSNPAPVGSIIVLYATGAGQTDPSGIDGQIAGSNPSHPLLRTSLQIGGFSCKVLYVGSAPGLISGALQINAVVPVGVPSGPSIPVLLTIGEQTSPSGVTVAIQ